MFIFVFLVFLVFKKKTLSSRKNEKDAVFSILFLSLFAERQGFEPWDQQAGQRFSRPPRSTTPASLLGRLPLAENGCKITNKNPHGKIFLSKKRQPFLQPFDIKRNNASAFQTPIRRPIPPSRPFPPPLPTVFCRDAACRVSVTTDPSVETQRAASPRQQRIQGDGACPVSTGEDVYRETQHAASLQNGNAAPCHIKIFVTNPCSTGSKLGTSHMVLI